MNKKQQSPSRTFPSNPYFYAKALKKAHMPVLYKATVNGEWTFDLQSDSLQAYDMARTDDASMHVLKDHHSFKAKILRSDFPGKSYRVSVNGKPYEVRIADPLDQQISDMGFELGSARNIAQVEAPMPGLILDIQVSEGDIVKEGDALLVLEAMKMENVILSPREGVVKKIAVTKGMAVDKKHLLVEFE